MSVVVIGECMGELSLEGGSAAIGYAGDTFNTAIYLARLGLPVAYATAVGKGDPFSEGILNLMAAEGVRRELVVEAPGRLPGLYAIERDEHGERSFYYWRENAPARELMTLADHSLLQRAMANARLVYVSAITLAILGEAGRAALLPLLAAAPAVALDTNYRARLWASGEAARAAVAAVAEFSRFISASVSDVEAFGGSPLADAKGWARGGAEVILRGEDRAIEVLGPDGRERFEADPATAVVDTTGAGDSFNAAYLAARLAGRPPGEAVRAGRSLAGAVVRHRGAIIPREAMPAEG